MIDLLVIIIGLLVGYFMYILKVLKADKNNDIDDIVAFVKEKDIETIFNLLSLYVIGTLWLNTNLLNVLPQSKWFAPIIGISTPLIWKSIMEWINKLVNKITR